MNQRVQDVLESVVNDLGVSRVFTVSADYDPAGGGPAPVDVTETPGGYCVYVDGPGAGVVCIAPDADTAVRHIANGRQVTVSQEEVPNVEA